MLQAVLQMVMCHAEPRHIWVRRITHVRSNRITMRVWVYAVHTRTKQEDVSHNEISKIAKLLFRFVFGDYIYIHR